MPELSCRLELKRGKGHVIHKTSVYIAYFLKVQNICNQKRKRFGDVTVLTIPAMIHKMS